MHGDISTGSEDVTIAISDNGIQQTHEDLRDNIAYNTGENTKTMV